MARKPINPKSVSHFQSVLYPLSPTFSQATIAEGKHLIFISGQVGRAPDADSVGDDIKSQTRQVFENLRLVLESVGATLDDILETDVFMINIERDLDGYLEVRREYFPENPPASTLVEVQRLVDPQYLVEVKAVAELDA